MFKKILTITAFLVVAAILVVGAVNRSQAGSGGGKGGGADLETGVSQHSSDPSLAISASAEITQLPAAGAVGLSPEETAALFYMREEEKLARDVYLALSRQWSLAIFRNIPRSEQVHTTAVLNLIERYGLDDPASAQDGVFTNPDLQALYTKMVERGSQSLPEALKVGGAIEEIDILDLQNRLAQTNHQDILQVFNNLLNGSYNHLRCFANTLAMQTGETYLPQTLSAASYQAITGSGVSGPGSGRGNMGRGGGHGRQP